MLSWSCHSTRIKAIFSLYGSFSHFGSTPRIGATRHFFVGMDKRRKKYLWADPRVNVADLVADIEKWLTHCATDDLALELLLLQNILGRRTPTTRVLELVTNYKRLASILLQRCPNCMLAEECLRACRQEKSQSAPDWLNDFKGGWRDRQQNAADVYAEAAQPQGEFGLL